MGMNSGVATGSNVTQCGNRVGKGHNVATGWGVHLGNQQVSVRRCHIASHAVTHLGNQQLSVRRCYIPLHTVTCSYAPGQSAGQCPPPAPDPRCRRCPAPPPAAVRSQCPTAGSRCSPAPLSRAQCARSAAGDDGAADAGASARNGKTTRDERYIRLRTVACRYMRLRLTGAREDTRDERVTPADDSSINRGEQPKFGSVDRGAGAGVLPVDASGAICDECNGWT